MIDLFSVSDECEVYGSEVALFDDVDFRIPPGRYALLARNPAYRTLVMDIIGGLRPPRHGWVNIVGSVSWPIGRVAMLRSKATGLDFIHLVADQYGIDRNYAGEFVTLMMSRPDYLDKALYVWPHYVRQELNFALGLVPEFDIYLVDAMIPSEDSRFTRLWQSLFEQRLVGKTLILSTQRPKQMLDYCAKALVYEAGQLEIVDDLEQCLERFPVRTAREVVGDMTNAGADDGADFFF
jgi:capsular polysaccharide transport system ATP-binding protein